MKSKGRPLWREGRETFCKVLSLMDCFHELSYKPLLLCLKPTTMEGVKSMNIINNDLSTQYYDSSCSLAMNCITTAKMPSREIRKGCKLFCIVSSGQSASEQLVYR